MTAFTLGEASGAGARRVRRAERRFVAVGGRPPASGAPHRTGAPVLRDSIEAGTFEDLFFAAPAKGETDRLLRWRAPRSTPAAGCAARNASAPATLTATERTLAGADRGAVRVYEEFARSPGSTAAASTPATIGSPRRPRSAAPPSPARCMRSEAAASSSASAGSSGWRGRGRAIGRPPTPIARCCRRGVLGYLPRWLRPAPLPGRCAPACAGSRRGACGDAASLSCRELAQATVGGSLGGCSPRSVPRSIAT